MADRTAAGESRIAVDIGGTFTDVVYRARDGTSATAKVPTMPERIAAGVLAGMEAVGADPAGVDVFVHGTTIALNALLEGKIGPVGLVTTGGFRDVLEIMRTNRRHMYDLLQEKPVPLVPRHLRAEVSARMSYRGKVLKELDANELTTIAHRFAQANVASIAVCLLHSYADPRHEQEIRDTLRELLPGVEISLSSDLSREWREFERTSTTVVNAATTPIMAAYLSDLTHELAEQRFGGRLLIMQSNGGVTSATDARLRPVASLMSGPSGAVAGAVRLARELGSEPNLVTLDIGGTSADVAVIDRGEPTARTVSVINGWPISVPSLDIEAIGAGGGSLARVDAFGALSVGPDSAGSTPGPACYGRGGTGATVTDAHVVLGRIDVEQALGGTVRLDGKAAHRTVERAVAKPFAMSVEQAAEGIIAVANSNMTRLLWEMIIGRGRDPRDFTLVALGGGGGLHACELAEGLGLRSVIVPPEPGAFSAIGMLAADVRHDFSQTIVASREGTDPVAIDSTFERLQELAEDRFDNQAMDNADVVMRRFLELRYRGQRSGLQVGIASSLRGSAAVEAARTAFEEEHERLFGFRRQDRQIEIVRLQLSVVGSRTPDARVSVVQSPAHSHRTARHVFANGDWHEATVVERPAFPQASTLVGPCVIEELTATTYVPSGWSAHIDHDDNLHLTRTNPRQGV